MSEILTTGKGEKARQRLLAVKSEVKDIMTILADARTNIIGILEQASKEESYKDNQMELNR